MIAAVEVALGYAVTLASSVWASVVGKALAQWGVLLSLPPLHAPSSPSGSLLAPFFVSSLLNHSPQLILNLLSCVSFCLSPVCVWGILISL